MIVVENVILTVSQSEGLPVWFARTNRARSTLDWDTKEVRWSVSSSVNEGRSAPRHTRRSESDLPVQTVQRCQLLCAPFALLETVLDLVSNNCAGFSIVYFINNGGLTQFCQLEVLDVE